MIFVSLVATIRDRLARNARYARLVREIESMSARDLADLRADRSEMLRQAWHQVYGDGKMA